MTAGKELILLVAGEGLPTNSKNSLANSIIRALRRGLCSVTVIQGYRSECKLPCGLARASCLEALKRSCASTTGAPTPTSASGAAGRTARSATA